MSILIFIALIFIVLYEAYTVWGPFSYRNTGWDTFTNVAAIIIWIALSALMAKELLALKPVGFTKIMCFIGIMLAMMLVMVGAGFVVWLLFQWISISVIPRIEAFFEKKRERTDPN